MKSIEKDNKILQELGFIFHEDLSLYNNLEKVVSAAYIMKLTSDAEHDFLNRNMQGYLLYTPLPDSIATFSKYCNLQGTVDTIYFVIRKDGKLASIFCINNDFIITQRQYIFDKDRIKDIYYNFASNLLRYSPKQNIPQPTLSAPILAMAQGGTTV